MVELRRRQFPVGLLVAVVVAATGGFAAIGATARANSRP
jgi:hypothetical protein